MLKGHVTGHKRERKGASDWFAAIEAENLRQAEEAELQEQRNKAATEPQENE